MSSSQYKQTFLKKCIGLKVDGTKLEKCDNMSIVNNYCYEHKYKHRLVKPDNCSICMENISDKIETPLECGHWIHKQCLKKLKYYICPICKQNMKTYEIKYIFDNNEFKYTADNILNCDISEFNNFEHFQEHFNMN